MYRPRYCYGYSEQTILYNYNNTIIRNIIVCFPIKCLSKAYILIIYSCLVLHFQTLDRKLRLTLLHINLSDCHVHHG